MFLLQSFPIPHNWQIWHETDFEEQVDYRPTKERRWGRGNVGRRELQGGDPRLYTSNADWLAVNTAEQKGNWWESKGNWWVKGALEGGH